MEVAHKRTVPLSTSFVLCILRSKAASLQTLSASKQRSGFSREFGKMYVAGKEEVFIVKVIVRRAVAVLCVCLGAGLTACTVWKDSGKAATKPTTADLSILRCDENTGLRKLSIFEIESLLFHLVTLGDASASKHLIDDNNHDGTLCFEIQKASEQNFHAQACLEGLDIKDNQDYRITFRAKSDRTRSVLVALQIDHPDWHSVGLEKSVSLAPNEWKELSFDFVARNTAKNHNKLAFYFGDEIGTLWLSRVSITKAPADRQSNASSILEDNHQNRLVSRR